MARRSRQIFYTIFFGTLSVLSTIAVIVAWNLIFTRYYTLASKTTVSDLGVGYWLILSIGDTFLMLVVAFLVVVLVAHVRQMLYSRRQDTFLDSVTHELKSPIASIKLSLDTLALRNPAPELQVGFHQMMRADLDRLELYIEHLLEAGRLEHGERSLNLTAVELAPLVQRCVDQISQRHQLGPEVMRLNVQLSPERAVFVTDVVALETIILNLLDNAIKYSPDTPRVTLSMQSDRNGLHLAVQDNGLGIPKESLKRVFDRFYRVEHPLHRLARGTGLGLYVVRTLVQRLGGCIRVKSDGTGEGSRFEVDLPLSVRSAKAPARQPQKVANAGKAIG
jgi:signal transduction histidine kinase